mgnify:CR=1 FL=1
MKNLKVSVPIRGLFNLTFIEMFEEWNTEQRNSFRPHQGII